MQQHYIDLIQTIFFALLTFFAKKETKNEKA